MRWSFFACFPLNIPRIGRAPRANARPACVSPSRKSLGQHENNEPRKRQRGQLQIDRQRRSAPSVGLARAQLHSGLSRPDARFSLDELDSAIAQHSLDPGTLRQDYGAILQEGRQGLHRRRVADAQMDRSERRRDDGNRVAKAMRRGSDRAVATVLASAAPPTQADRRAAFAGAGGGRENRRRHSVLISLRAALAYGAVTDQRKAMQPRLASSYFRYP